MGETARSLDAQFLDAPPDLATGVAFFFAFRFCAAGRLLCAGFRPWVEGTDDDILTIVQYHSPAIPLSLWSLGVCLNEPREQGMYGSLTVLNGFFASEVEMVLSLVWNRGIFVIAYDVQARSAALPEFEARRVRYELQSKIPVSPLITPMILPYIVPYITPLKKFRLWLTFIF